MATSSALLVIFVVCICIVSAQIPVPSSIGPAVTLPTTTSSVESKYSIPTYYNYITIHAAQLRINYTCI